MLRKAKVSDGKKIFFILQEFALKGIVLPRSLGSIYENIRDFWLYELNNEIVATGSLHIYNEDLAEIKSLVVLPEYQKKGIGREIVLACLNEARELGIKKVFALTYVPEFFGKLGFKITEKSDFPQKVWTDCIHCTKFYNCNEIPVVKDILPILK